MKREKGFLQKESGFALIMVLWVIIVLIIAAAGLLVYRRNSGTE